MVRTKQILISSRNKTLSSISNSNFNVVFKQTDSIQNCKRIVIDSISFINTFYNINETNNTLIFTIDGINFLEVTIPVGQYDLAQFITALETEMNILLAPESVVITQDPITKKLVFTCTVPIGFVGSTLGSTMGEVVGLNANDNTSLFQPFNMPNFPNLSGPRQVYIISETLSNLTSMVSIGGKLVSVLKAIPLNADFGCPVNFIADMIETNEVYFPEPINISNIDIKITDNLNNILDLEGLDFEMIIRSYY